MARVTAAWAVALAAMAVVNPDPRIADWLAAAAVRYSERARQRALQAL